MLHFKVNFNQINVLWFEQSFSNSLKCNGDDMLARSACESSSKDKYSASISSGRAMPLFQIGLAFSYQRGHKTWSFKRSVYYANTIATFQILLKSGDIEVNPSLEAVTNGRASVATQN